MDHVLATLHRYATLARRRGLQMSLELEVAMLRISKAEGHARQILQTMCHFADERREIQVGMHDLAAVIGRQEETARYHVRQLRKHGEVEVIARGGGSKPNTYRISARYAQFPDPGAA